MIRYLQADTLAQHPKLQATMFRDRAVQFRDRLGWPVSVDANGWERDDYDAMNPLYVIWQMPDGSHGGSMRFLPTTGDSMINDHFLHLTDGVRIASPFIWECTRFCLGPDIGTRGSAALMLGGLEVGLGHGLSHAVGGALGFRAAPQGAAVSQGRDLARGVRTLVRPGLRAAAGDGRVTRATA